MKKKGLIVTLFHRNYNYGGILQAYALYTKLNGLGVECLELDYLAERNVYQRLLNKVMEVRKDGVRKVIIRRLARQNWKRAFDQYVQKYMGDPLQDRFEQFMSREFKKTALYNQKTILKIKESYDFCIVGGDQMWNPDWFDKNYYLAFSKAPRNFAYSCSVGKDNITNEDEKKILSHIKKIDAISVRESVLREWFQERGYQAKLVCDPVFLLTKSDWDEFSADCERICEEEYIFAYLLGETSEVRMQIRRLADRLGLKIVSIPHIWRRYNPNDEGFADYAPIHVDPREFVGIIKNAKCILTDSFHGTAFSIIFEKDFYCFSRFEANDSNSLNSRLLSILQYLGMEERYIFARTIGDISEDFGHSIDYKVISTTLDDFRKESEQFLEKQLGLEC